METFFTGGYGDKEKIEERIGDLKDKLKTSSENGMKIVKDRLARLTGKMGRIMCGGNT